MVEMVEWCTGGSVRREIWVCLFLFLFLCETKEKRWESEKYGQPRVIRDILWCLCGWDLRGRWVGLTCGAKCDPLFFFFFFFLYKPRASPLSRNPCYTLPFKNLSAICNMSLELSITWQWWNYQFSTLSPKIKLLLHWYLNFPSQLVWNSKKQKPIAKCNTKKKS